MNGWVSGQGRTSWFLALSTRRALPPTDFLELRLCGGAWLLTLEKLFSSAGARLRGCVVAFPGRKELNLKPKERRLCF